MDTLTLLTMGFLALTLMDVLLVAALCRLHILLARLTRQHENLLEALKASDDLGPYLARKAFHGLF